MMLSQESLTDPQEADQRFVFQLFERAFQQAVQRTELLEQQYEIAGKSVSLKFAGDALRSQIHPALAHSQILPTESPNLTVCLWDRATSQTALPYFLERLRLLLKKQRVQRVEPRGEIKNYYGDRIRSGVHFSPDSFSLFDRQTQMGLYWTEDAQTLPYYERSSPLRMILSWWLKDLGYQYVHAAAVGTEHQGALLVGAGGSGKSMAALACVDSSLQYLSDDYCAIAVDPVPQIYSLYNSAKLWRAADIARLTVLTPLFDTSASNAEKHIAFLTQLGRDVLRKTVPARTVLLVRHVSQPQTTYRPIASGVVLKGLLPWTLLQLPNAGGETAQLLKRFLQPLPCFELLTGTDLSQIPTTIQSIFSTLSRS